MYAPPTEHAFVGKGQYLKRRRLHGRGRSATMYKYRAQLTVCARGPVSVAERGWYFKLSSRKLPRSLLCSNLFNTSGFDYVRGVLRGYTLKQDGQAGRLPRHDMGTGYNTAHECTSDTMGDVLDAAGFDACRG